MSEIGIAFVGQCHTVGYPGVPADAAFPEVCRHRVQAARPGQKVRVLLEPYYHPADLARIVGLALRRRPRVVIVEVVGWLAVTGPDVVDLSRLPRAIRSAAQRAQHLRHAARAVSAGTKGGGVIYDVRTQALGLASDVLRPLFPRRARPTVAEYEAAVSDALALIAKEPGIAAVVQGPGAPNLALDSARIAPGALDLYRDVRAMSQRVAAAHGALHVERWDTVSTGFFLPGSIRPTMEGHSAWGHLLAEELLTAGIV